MLNSYERHVMAGYLSNMANRFHRESPEAHGVVEWLTENADLPGLDRRSLELESESLDSKERMSAKQRRVCRRMLDDLAKDTAGMRPDRLTRRLRRLGRVIRLSAEEISILQFLLRYQTQPEFEDLFDTVANGRHRGFHRSVLNLKSRLPSSALGISASTLRRRLAADAPRSWEVTQVNEMLTWMESHPLPFACTTNDGERLDGAALRRFVFKAKLGFLKPESAAVAFRTFFGLEAPASLRTLALLTPGDFAVVRRKAAVLGSLSDGEALVEMLRAECTVKPKHTASIGFGR